MNVTRSLAPGRPGALLALLGCLAGACRGLPVMLQPAPEDERELPRPEEGARPRTRLAPQLETFALRNGLTVVLLEDHALPRVALETSFAVGTRDEEPGQHGFARLFEARLRARVAGATEGALERRIEAEGGSHHAGVGRDHSRSLGLGPAALLPSLLELEAARFAALGEDLTEAELERLRAALDGEPARGAGEAPYAALERLLPVALYPPGHPYHRPAVADRADLAAATAADVSAFFRERYVPASATLVVAGDFDPQEVRARIERTFGALPARAPPPRRAAGPAVLARETRVLHRERVELPKLVLAWPSPPELAPGDAELDLLATILAEGSASRLEQRLVLDTRLAQAVDASQRSGELGSVFVIEALAAPGVELDALAREILLVVEALARDGPSADELARAQARQEARFRQRMQGLLARVEAIQSYRRRLGVSDGFQLDLARWTEATRADLRDVARAVLGPGRVDLRILPEREAAAPDGAACASDAPRVAALRGRSG